MKKVIDFLRKIGLLHVSKGDFQTGEFDSREDLKEEAPEQSQEESVSEEENR